MKKTCSSILLILFISCNLFSQSTTQYGWEWLNPSPTHALLNKIKFANMSTGYIIGSNGTIMKTTNSGINWLFLEIWVQPGYYDYTLLHVFNKDTLIVGGGYQYFYKSYNGGANWSIIKTTAPFTLRSLYFRNSMTGYAAGENGTLIRTSDGGNSWHQIPTNLQLITSTVCFPDDNTGFMAGQKLARTTNGGATWDTSSVITNAVTSYFINTQKGFIGAGKLLMTLNSGISWLDISNGGYNFRSIDFLDSLNGWALADNLMLRTTDGGIRWTVINTTAGNSISIVDPQNWYSCSTDSYGGVIKRTTNGGANWSVLSSRYETGDIFSIYFLNAFTGYYGGTSGNLRKTTDGGHNWITVTSMGHFIDAIKFFDENTGYVGITGQLRKTTNGGLNWTINNMADGVDAISFADMNTGYALTERSFIYKTINAGESWNEYPLPTEWLSGLWVFDANKVIASGYKSTSGIAVISITTDGGANWNSQFNNWGSMPNSIWFTNQNTGYFACGYGGYGGRVFKTTDFCQTWTYLNIGNGYDLNTIQFFDANTGMVSGYNGTAFKTTNAGLNWSALYRITDYHFFTMHCPDVNTCYYGGWYDIIAKTSNGGIILSTNEQQNVIPKKLNLSQNYPNPFNPSTRISFSIPVAENGRDRTVRLIIYDVTGREVATLVNSQMQPGNYSVDWDGSNYPSGVYFYRLSINNEQLASKKMVLIK